MTKPGQDPRPFRFNEPVQSRDLLEKRLAKMVARSRRLTTFGLRDKSFCLKWAKNSHDAR